MWSSTHLVPITVSYSYRKFDLIQCYIFVLQKHAQSCNQDGKPDLMQLTLLFELFLHVFVWLFKFVWFYDTFLKLDQNFKPKKTSRHKKYNSDANLEFSVLYIIRIGHVFDLNNPICSGIYHW